MKFIVGIGNPGKKYEGTRHNVGFEVLEGLAGKLGCPWKELKKLQADTAKADGVVLLKPGTFVNNTGESLAALLKEYHPKPDQILLVCDDVNLDFGKLRIRATGSAGGHHGLESVIAAFDSAGEAAPENFSRLRFGVRSEEMPRDLNSYVLEKFSGVEKQSKPELLQKAAQICESWIHDGFEAAQKKLSQLQG